MRTFAGGANSALRKWVQRLAQEGPQGFSKIGPPCDAEGFRPSIHQVMAIVAPTGTAGVMVVDRRGLHRAPPIASTLAHGQGRLRLQCLPARCGHHRTPMEGFWRVLKDQSGAGRYFPDLQQLYWRVRRVCMAHHEQPIYAFRW